MFKTFDEAVKANPDAHPLFNSDWGQYTNRTIHRKLEKAKVEQSMYRAAHCIANDPTEGFGVIQNGDDITASVSPARKTSSK